MVFWRFQISQKKCVLIRNSFNLVTINNNAHFDRIPVDRLKTQQIHGPWKHSAVDSIDTESVSVLRKFHFSNKPHDNFIHRPVVNCHHIHNNVKRHFHMIKQHCKQTDRWQRIIDSFTKWKSLLMPLLHVKSNYAEIILVFSFTCNHWRWLHVTYNTEVISKLFQCFISRVTTSEIISILFQLLKLFLNYFSDIERVGKYSRAAIKPLK